MSQLVHQTDSDRESLIDACRQGKHKTVERLLSMGISQDATLEDDGWTVLMYAVRYGHVQVVETLLAHGANVHATASRGETALYEAARKGYSSIIDILIQHKANIEAISSGGVMPLCIAVMNGHVSAVEILLHHGANVIDGRTPLFDIIGHKCPRSPLFWFNIRNDRISSSANINDMIRRLPQSRDINTKVIPFATSCIHSQIATILLQAGANPNASNFHGQTPLMIAAQKGCIHVVNTLLQAGANPNAIDNDFNTTLDIAVIENHVSVVNALLELNVCMTNGPYLLEHARASGNQGIIDVLEPAVYQYHLELAQETMTHVPHLQDLLSKIASFL